MFINLIYLQTPKVEIRPLSSVGIVDIGDDLPCKLCQQLVGHLKDLLVANTTETEFKEVLEGFCKQTKSFKDEVCIYLIIKKDKYFQLFNYYFFLHYLLNTLLVYINCRPILSRNLPIPCQWIGQ